MTFFCILAVDITFLGDKNYSRYSKGFIDYDKKRSCIILLFLLGLYVSVLAQNSSQKVSFEQLIYTFENYGSEWGFEKNDILIKPYLYKGKDFDVLISRKPIYFEIDTLIIKNPFYTEDIDDWDDNYINFPKSFSVIYEDNLISLFDNGKFVCHNLNNNSRNKELENKLNSKRFRYHWIIDGKLYAKPKGVSFNSLYYWNGEKWKKSQIHFPLKNQPILFSDEEFIVFRGCNGEFGGMIYFFDRKTQKTYFTESTCANTVFKEGGKYHILAHLGHMIGRSEIKIIDNPKKLTKAKKTQLKNHKKHRDYQDKTNTVTKPLDLFGIQLFSTFQNKDKRLFLVYLNEGTFLAEIDGNEIQIVNPLFNNDKYTHDTITKTYDNYILINMDFYGIAIDREVSIMIVKDNKITLLDWNESHNR